jgi:hypothetical protein
MKKFAIVTGMLMAGVALAGTLSPLVQLNQRIEMVLAPFNNANTQAQLVFRALSTDAERAIALDVNGQYRKIGSENHLNLIINRITYQYGDGSAPKTVVDLAVETDFTKILDQRTLNQVIPQLDSYLKEITDNTFRGLREAMTVKLDVREKKQDSKGNYTTLQAKLQVDIDLGKLPSGKSSDEIFFTNAELDISVDLKDGARLVLSVVSNPSYRQFRRDQVGLKETIEEILKEDSSFIRGIKPTLQSLDEFATNIVNQKI